MEDASESFFRKLLDNLYDGVYMVDARGQITYWNAGAERITGYAAEEAVGRKSCRELLSHVDGQGNALCDTACPLQATLQDGQPREVEAYLHCKSGDTLPVLVRVSPLRDSNGRIKGGVQVFSDTSFMEAAARRIQELEQMALVDALTGIGNRRFLEMTLIARLSEARRYGWSLGLLFIDIDDFKRVNDTYGHDVGDVTLKIVAETVAGSVRPFDVVARWGGEEFIALLINVGQQELTAIAERARSQVELAGYNRGSEVIRVTVSIGATRSRADDTLNQIIRRADELMYRSKARGRNCVSADGD